MVPEENCDINALPPGSTSSGAGANATVQASAMLEVQLDTLERRMSQLQRQVQRLQRFASLGTVSTILAHEFNNLLTPILSYCQYAQTQSEPELLKKAVAMAYKNSQRLSTLCGKILGMASDDLMGPVDTEIRPLLDDAASCLGRDLGKEDIEVTLDAAPNLRARAHAGSLRQVLFNLVLNARQAMLDRGGRLRLSARQREGGGVEITIADTGCGIRAEDLEHIFEPFFTTKGHEHDDRRGLGLGLYITRQLMEEQGGTISVQSRRGSGTTFTLTLPDSEP